ncbi:MAG: hypothetical protein ACTHN5_06080 [Phycisphaerae bacterium]
MAKLALPLVLLCTATLLPTTGKAITFQAQDLGNLNADTPLPFNNFLDQAGRVSGYFFPASNNQAFLYQGDYVSLGSLGGSGGTYVGALNSHFVAGYSSTPSAQHAFLYDGSIHDLGSLGGFSAANAVNASGAVVGNSFSTATGIAHAFLYKNDAMLDLTPSSSGASNATGISDDGHVAGYFSTAPGANAHAFLYDAGSLQDLNPLLPSASDSLADGITRGGAVYGRFNDVDLFVYDGSMHTDTNGFGLLVSSSPDGKIAGYDPNGALFYHDGAFTSLGLGPNSRANAINDAAQIVGAANGRAFFYDGTFHDLNSLVSLPTGWLLTSAYGINNQSQIVASGFNSSLHKSDVFLLSVPEPATLPLTCTALLLLATPRRK